jgi:hypothetical protein
MMKEKPLLKLEAFGQSIWHGGCVVSAMDTHGARRHKIVI